MLKQGTQAPEFEAALDTGETFRLADYRGQKNVILYFYPKDFTPGCTREACAFRDNYDEVAQYEAIIVGVSSDKADSHQSFREKHSLNFPLISDPEKRLIKLYDAMGLLGLMTARVTYVIGKDGVIKDVLRHDLAIGKHLEGVLKSLQGLTGAGTPAR